LAVAALALLLVPGCSGGGDHGLLDGGEEPITCTTRNDCPGRLGCVDGICGSCSRDRDCLVTEFCNPLDQLCQSIFDHDECGLNEDCDLGAFCVQGLCKDASEVVACVDAGDCQPDERCDPLNLVCVMDLGCNRDADCAEGEVCNLASNRCESACTEETQEVVCGVGRYCNEFGRCVDCLSDEDCGLGLSCDLTTQTCQGQNSCLSNRDCLPGTVCNPQTRQCTEAPPECLSNGDCPESQVCDPVTGRCVDEACRDDAHEPNDNPAEAVELAEGRFDDLELCGANQDWFAIDLVRGDRLQAIIIMDFLASDHFQALLLSPEADELLQEDSMLLDYTVAVDGRYLLRFQTTDPRVSYDLILTVSQGVPCDDDVLEPNDSALEAIPTTAGQLTGLAICPRDEDWFVVERGLEQRLEARLDFLAMEGDLDLELLAGDGQTVVMRSAGAGDGEFVFVDDHPGTRFFLRVWGDAQVANHYELSVDLSSDSTGGN